MCRCLSMQNSQRAVGGTAHASDHTSHRDQPWMLTLSNCVKPYLTSYRVVSHHQLSCPVFWFLEQAPRAQAQIMWRKLGEDRSPGLQGNGGLHYKNTGPLGECGVPATCPYSARATGIHLWSVGRLGTRSGLCCTSSSCYGHHYMHPCSICCVEHV